MQYTKLGNSDLNVSRICLGCMGFGDAKNGQHSWTIDEPHSREIIKHAISNGINFFDTAIGYQSGTSEKYVGRAIKDYAKREDMVIATKFLPRSQAEIENNVSGEKHIQQMVDTSLSNLGLDYIDLYIYHMWDWNTPMEEIMAGLNEAVKSGKVRYLGIANCFAWQLSEINNLARNNGWPEFISVQNHYNLIFREEEREMALYCQEKNIAMTPYSALASGRLAKRPGETSRRLQEDSYAKFKYDSTAEMDSKIIKRVMELADKYQTSMTQISLAWLLTKVASPIVGATKLHHIDDPVKAADFKLTNEDITYLEELYTVHPLSGVMAQNRPEDRAKSKVWGIGKQTLSK